MNLRIHHSDGLSTYYFNKIEDIQSELLKYNIRIANDLRIDNDAYIGENVEIGGNVQFKGENINIGSNTIIRYNCIINEDVDISGKVVIDSNVEIERKSTLKGEICIGSYSKIGTSSTIRGLSKIGQHTQIHEHCYVNDSIIDNNVVIESETSINQSTIATNVRIGQNSSIKTNSCINKNIIIGNDTTIPDCSTISQSIQLVTSEGHILSWYGIDEISYKGFVEKISWWQNNYEEFHRGSPSNLYTKLGPAASTEFKHYLDLIESIYKLLPTIEDEKLTIEKLNGRKFYDLNAHEFNFLINQLIIKNHESDQGEYQQISAFLKRKVNGYSPLEFIRNCKDVDILLWLYYNIGVTDKKNWIFIKMQCAKLFIDLTDDIRCIKALETACRYVDGSAQESDLMYSLGFTDKAMEIEENYISELNADAWLDDDPNTYVANFNMLEGHKLEANQRCYSILTAHRAVNIEHDDYFLNSHLKYLTPDFKILHTKAGVLCKKHIPFDDLVINL